MLDAHDTTLDLSSQFPPGADRDAFLAGVCTELNSDHPEQAAKLVESMSVTQVQAQTGGIAASCWRGPTPRQPYRLALPIKAKKEFLVLDGSAKPKLTSKEGWITNTLHLLNF